MRAVGFVEGDGLEFRGLGFRVMHKKSMMWSADFVELLSWGPLQRAFRGVVGI